MKRCAGAEEDPDCGWDPVGVVREAIARAAAAVVAVPWLEDGSRDAPSCTVVLAVWDGADVTVGWLGDSRAYWLDGAGCRQLTVDHSWAEEQVSSGRLSREMAEADGRAHAITRWLGADAPPGPCPITHAAATPAWPTHRVHGRALELHARARRARPARRRPGFRGTAGRGAVPRPPRRVSRRARQRDRRRGRHRAAVARPPWRKHDDVRRADLPERVPPRGRVRGQRHRHRHVHRGGGAVARSAAAGRGDHRRRLGLDAAPARRS